MPTHGRYDPSNDFGAQVRYLGTFIAGARSMNQHVDTQLNILIGFSTGLFAFAMALIDRGGPPALPTLLLAGFSSVAAITALIGVHPPRAFRKRRQVESALYHRELTKLVPTTAAKRIHEIMKQPEELAKQVTLEAYNMYKYYYQPKREFYSLSRTVLLTGIIAALAANLTELIVGSVW